MPPKLARKLRREEQIGMRGFPLGWQNTYFGIVSLPFAGATFAGLLMEGIWIIPEYPVTREQSQR